VQYTREVFPTKEFKAKAAEFVLVKIDFDKDQETVNQYKVEGIPDIQFLAADGTVKHRVIGFLDTDSLIAEMEAALAKG